jgi:hypothetical protein
MIEVVLKVPGVGVENPTCCSACLFSKLDLNFCLKLTTLSHPPQTDPFPCIFSLYISPPKAPHMLETCLDRLPQREIYPKPVQISTTEPSHHRNFHMYLSHMDGWRVPKASKQSLRVQDWDIQPTDMVILTNIDQPKWLYHLVI